MPDEINVLLRTLKEKPALLNDEIRAFLVSYRQTLLMQLGKIEDMLGLERSVVPRRKQAK